LFKRDDLEVSEIRAAAVADLRPGEVRLAIEKLGLTANNASYARFGDSEVIPFWNAFPGPPGFGRVPVWSFVRVAESRHPDVSVGRRYFGYVPMSSHHTVVAEPTPRGLMDTSPQREFLHPWYRTFQQVSEPDDLDDFRALMRPVFPASFNLADLVQEQAALGAKSAIITSASCKTAIAMVDELAGRGVDIATIGITSARHQAFVEQLGRYDEVLPYDALASAPVTSPAVFIDFTGDAIWRRAVYQHFAPSLRLGALIGFTHPAAEVLPPPGLPDPQPELFFTPVVEDQAISREGADEYYSRYHEAEDRFLRHMGSWLTIERRQGPEQLVDAFHSLLAGEQRPEVSPILLP
jgi:hypothetical protein